MGKFLFKILFTYFFFKRCFGIPQGSFYMCLMHICGGPLLGQLAMMKE
jgi:hypothetical protein